MPGPAALNEYALDFWQRSLLFLDILRQRGNAREEMLVRGASSVLIYDTELVMRGDTLPRPVNYSLLHVIPPAGVARHAAAFRRCHADGEHARLAATRDADH
jgi:Protein of unknown function (DUF3141)